MSENQEILKNSKTIAPRTLDTRNKPINMLKIIEVTKEELKRKD